MKINKKSKVQDWSYLIVFILFLVCVGYSAGYLTRILQVDKHTYHYNGVKYSSKEAAEITETLREAEMKENTTRLEKAKEKQNALCESLGGVATTSNGRNETDYHYLGDTFLCVKNGHAYYYNQNDNEFYIFKKSVLK